MQGKGLAIAAVLLAGLTAQGAETTIRTDEDAAPQVHLAAREVQRYVYLRTGRTLRIEVESAGNSISLKVDPSLENQVYRLRTHGDTLHITGGSPVAVLYGAYAFAEKLGVRFYLHGDVIPDKRIPFTIPDLNETHVPLFEHRGIQPFHDFTEGPDWWGVDDYKAYMSQLAKLRMNFMGLHCYPEGKSLGPEPTVWIGLPEDVNEDGTVNFSYPSHWASTSAGTFGYSPARTSDFAGGAHLLFEGDDHGSPMTDGFRPKPQTVEDANALFNRVGRHFHDMFSHGKTLGITFTIGTHTPLQIPEKLQEHLEAKGMDPTDPATVRKLYEGIFTRIRRAYPLDYYWLWTPESWLQGPNPDVVESTLQDITLASEALRNVGQPFQLGACGWVLGPPNDRTAFDRVLPGGAAMACINQGVGYVPVEPGFIDVKDRPRWAIPWFEDDAAMVTPQCWVGRIRRDAADAYAYGCTGLMGIHWRTKVLAPNIAALAAAGWDQAGWNEKAGTRVTGPDQRNDVHVEGRVARYMGNPIAGTEEDPIFQTCRFNQSAYRLEIPGGTYTVTLKFCEVAYNDPGKRVFGVKLQGRQVIDKLDVFETAGKNKALDFIFENIKVIDGTLEVAFTREVEYPFIAAIVVDGTADPFNQFPARPFTRKINCGGDQYRDYEADLPSASASGHATRDLPAQDFYRDWCLANFGPELAEELAVLFQSLDGAPGNYSRHQARIPRPSQWIGGPGGIPANGNPWEQESKRYAFVDEMATLRPRIEGKGNLARFDYWLNTFRYLRAVGRIGCTRGKLDRIMKQVDDEQNPARRKQFAEKQALPVRIELARQWEQMMTYLLAATDTPGEMGTIGNLEQHVRRNARGANFLDLHDGRLAEILDRSLPDKVCPSDTYAGKPRIIVPTVRTSRTPNETLALSVMVLDNRPPQSLTLQWRSIGETSWREVKWHHLGRAVWRGELPPAGEDTVEYYIEAKTAGGETLCWPVTAPELNQTVVVMP